MKLSITIAVAGLLLAPALFSAVEGTCWRARATYGLYQANAGSALCFGQEYPQVSPPAPISYVWLLHGNCSQAANRFQRYSIGDPGTLDCPRFAGHFLKRQVLVLRTQPG
jgi:hypothetical protein